MAGRHPGRHDNMLILAFAVLAPVAILAAPWCVRRPLRTVLPVYAGTLPIASVVTLDLPLPSPFNTLSSIVGALAIVACVVHVILYRRARTPTLPVALWVVFLAWAGFSTFWALDPGLSYEKLLVASPLVVLLLAASLVPAEEADLDALRLAIILSGVAVGAYAFILLVTGATLPAHGTAGTQRFSLATGAGETNPNILAASLLLPLVVSVERILLGGRRWIAPGTWRLVGMAGAFFVFVALLLTGSRGGLIAGIIAFVVTLVAARRVPEARPWIKRTLVAVAAIGLAGPAAFGAAQLLGAGRPPDILASPPIQRLVNPTTGSSGRTEIWTAGFLACRVHCAVGSGLDNFSAAFDERYAFSSAAKNLERGQVAHNLYLAVAVETGLVGLTLLLLAVLAEWRAVSVPSVVAGAPGLRAAMLGVLVANVFLSAVWFKYFWLVFAVNRVAEGALRRPMPESASERGLAEVGVGIPRAR